MKQLLLMIHIIMRVSTESPWKSIGILFCQIIGIAALLLLGLYCLGLYIQNAWSADVYNSLYVVLLYGLLYALIRHYRKTVYFSTQYAAKTIGLGWITSLLLVHLCWAVALSFGGLAVSAVSLTFPYVLQILIEAAALALAVAWLEELLFRGLILSLLEKGYAPHQAVWWQALLFSGVHQCNTQWPWTLRIGSGIGLFLAGLVLGLARQKSKGLSWSIGLHAGWIFICQWGVRGWGLSLPIAPSKPGGFMTQEVNPISGIPAILLLTGVSYVIMSANRTLKKDVQVKGNTNGSSSSRKISRHH